jgi:hypothetical protein
MNKKILSVAIKEQLRPITAYWVLLIFSFLIFALAVLSTSQNFDGEDIAILLGFFGVTSLGCALGQLAALLRFREIVGLIHCAVVLFFGTMLITSNVLPEELMIPIGMYMFLGNIMFFGGMWSLQAGRAIFASWPPILFSIGSIIIIINDSPERLATWKSGAKWMVWNTTSLLGFLIVTLLLISYLVIRENLRVFRWRNGPRTTIASEEILQSESKARISMRGWVSLLTLSCFLSVGVAFLSPYLWQTAPRDSGDKKVESFEEFDCNNYSGCSPPPECRETSERSQQDKREKQPSPKQGSTEQIKQILEQVGQFLWILMWMLILLVLAYFVFGGPMRRIFYVRHYREPLWPISTTKKIENQWDLIRISLADLGVYGKRGDSAVALAQEAIPRLKEVTGNTRRIPGLLAAAQIRDRVVFGLGVGAEDAQKMNENSNWVYDSVWNRLGNMNQIKALYRRKLW